jgi:hypothetical protein
LAVLIQNGHGFAVLAGNRIVWMRLVERSTEIEGLHIKNLLRHTPQSSHATHKRLYQTIEPFWPQSCWAWVRTRQKPG